MSKKTQEQQREQARAKKQLDQQIYRKGDCTPYLGLRFNSKAFQSTLSKWGGQMLRE